MAHGRAGKLSMSKYVQGSANKWGGACGVGNRGSLMRFIFIRAGCDTRNQPK